MRTVIRLLNRLLPALLMASSVSLLTAGLLSYAPSAFGDWHTPEPVIVDDPLFSAPPATSGPTPSGIPTQPASVPPGSAVPSISPSLGASAPPVVLTPTPTPGQTDPATGPSGAPATPGPTATDTPPISSGRGIATRIRISSLSIDLAVVPGDLVVPGNRDFYPLCDVAMFMGGFSNPGQTGSTYIYAHAQRGMFLPLLRASQNNNGASMVGALIELYTSDNRLHLYELFRVKRHATDLSLANVPAAVHQLVLQTSEGPSGTVPKLQVAARPISVVPASAAEANPRPRPRVCLP